MSFCSHIFIILFLPITLSAYFLLSNRVRKDAANTFLLIASIVFYIYYDYKCLLLLLVLTFFNYLVCKNNCFWHYRTRAIITIAVCINVITLGIFKYFNFFSDTICNILKTDTIHVSIILPLGISFFTFQQISVLVDSYRDEVKGVNNVRDYFLYSFFFPTITSGPITYYNELVPQLNDSDKKNIDYDNILKGIYLFGLGLAKKVLLAQPFAEAVQTGYDSLYGLGLTNALIMMIGYSLQIYFDFSGYSDMALGVAKMFNIDLPKNFDSPYKTYNINDFWSKWHITLTRFLAKYIYIPLGGNRKGRLRTYTNVIIVFLISGLWHGANITFVVWGFLHGVASVIYRIFKQYIDRWHAAFSWFINFIFISMAWVYFRAETLALGNTLVSKIFQKKLNFIDNIDLFIANCFNISEISFLYEKIFKTSIASSYPNLMLTFWFMISIYIVLCTENNMRILDDDFIYKRRYAVYSVILIVLSVISISGVSTFIYSGF